MSFMELQVTQKGTLVSADCSRCGVTHYAHEWATWDFNGERDAMQAGTLACRECGRPVDAATFHESPRKQYAARYSAPGYMDATDYHYGTNRRALVREVRDLYGE